MTSGSIIGRMPRRASGWSRRTRSGRRACGARRAARTPSARPSMRRWRGGTASGSSPIRRVVLEALTRQQSTFTRRDLARMVNRHTADAEQFAEAMAKVEASPELVRLGADGRRQDRFTTREMLATEQRMERAAGELAERQAHRVESAPAAGADGVDHARARAGAGVPARDAGEGSQRGGGLRRDRQEHDACGRARGLGGRWLPGARRGAVGDCRGATGGRVRDREPDGAQPAVPMGAGQGRAHRARPCWWWTRPG